MADESIAQGLVSWRQRWRLILMLAVAIIFPIVMLAVAVHERKPIWFVRASAVPLALAGILAYRSLFRSYEKTKNAHLRLLAHLRAGGAKKGFPGWIETSRTQQMLDWGTLVTLILGTVMASVGDVIVEWLMHA